MYTGIKFTNNASTQTVKSVSSVDTTITVAENEAAIFPRLESGDYFLLTLMDINGQHEIVKCTSRTDSVFTVVRAQEGTTAKTFPVGTLLELRLTAESIVKVADDASTVKPHANSDVTSVGAATALIYGHVKISDNFESGEQALNSTICSPYAFQQAIARLQGLKQETLITTSTTWTVPETGTYKITCVGGGGRGGNGSWGGWGHQPDCNAGGFFYSGGGGGGGGSGQVVTVEKQLVKGEVINLVVGSSGGSTNAGSYAVALAGTAGSNATDATCVRGSCTNASCYDWSIGHAGYGGAAGYSYGTLATAGANGGASNTSYATVLGGVGGHGGVSVEGTFGTGGKGGNGGSTSETPNGFVYAAPELGITGTQGCIKIQNVIGK